MSGTPQSPPQPGPQAVPQAPSMVSQQYVVINGNFGDIQPPVNYKAIGATANIQLIITAVMILLGVLGILFACVNSIDGMPIWTALFFYIVAGILGRVAVRRRNNCSVIAYMVLSILSAIAAASLLLSMIEAVIFEATFHNDFDLYAPPIQVSVLGRVVVDVCVIMFALSEMIIAIIASAVCCRGTCCAPPVPMQVQYSQAVQAGSTVALPQGFQTVNGQPLVIPQGQAVFMNPSSPPPSYEAGPLPEKSDAPSETAAADQGREAHHSIVSSEAVGQDDRQPLVSQ